jgi:hypothetical protein
MRADDTARLCFAPTGDVFLQNERLEFKPGSNVSFPAGHIQLTTLYDVGFLTTDSGSCVRVMRPRLDTIRVGLLSPDHNNLIILFDSFQDALSKLAIRRDDIVPGYNCHGFTFGGSRYWINDDQIDKILADDGYTPTDEPDAQILVFRQHGKIVHSALVDRSQGIFIGKTGVRGFCIARSIADAAQSNSFDTYTFYKKEANTR